MTGGATGFWSYVRKDDEGDHGRILALARDLRDRYRIHTARELELFVDRDSLQWGEAWEQRINEAIAGTTFFIPVITPSYFRSQACRHELLKFVREAERLGLEQLLMPIYWVRVPELEDDPQSSSDIAIRLVAKYDWGDFRAAGLEDRDSSAYRKAVADLAEELGRRAVIASRVEDVPAVNPSAGDGKRQDEVQSVPSLFDGMTALQESALRTTSYMTEIEQQIEAIDERAEQSNSNLNVPDADMKMAMTITGQLAHSLEEPAKRIDDVGSAYVEMLGELDAGVQAQLEQAEARRGRGGEDITPEEKKSLEESLVLLHIARQGRAGLAKMLERVENLAKLSRSLTAPVETMRRGLISITDGNAIVEEWARRAAGMLDRELPAEPKG